MASPPPPYESSASDGVLRALAGALADPDASVARAARGGFAAAARAARRPALRVGVEALRCARARAAAATGRCVADPQALALLPLLADAVRDAPPGALDDGVRAAVRAAALGACHATRLRGACAAQRRSGACARCSSSGASDANWPRRGGASRRVSAAARRRTRCGVYLAPRRAASAPCVARYARRGACAAAPHARAPLRRRASVRCAHTRRNPFRAHPLSLTTRHPLPPVVPFPPAPQPS
jgi:hypothetical protein